MGGGGEKRDTYTLVWVQMYIQISALLAYHIFPAGIINQDMLAVAGLSHFL